MKMLLPNKIFLHTNYNIKLNFCCNIELFKAHDLKGRISQLVLVLIKIFLNRRRKYSLRFIYIDNTFRYINNKYMNEF